MYVSLGSTEFQWRIDDSVCVHEGRGKLQIITTTIWRAYTNIIQHKHRDGNILSRTRQSAAADEKLRNTNYDLENLQNSHKKNIQPLQSLEIHYLLSKNLQQLNKKNGVLSLMVRLGTAVPCIHNHISLVE